MLETLTKKCSCCNNEYSVNMFYKDTRNRDGLRCLCRSCHNKSSNNWSKANPDKAKAARDKWYARNKEAVIAKKKAWVVNNRERESDGRLKRLYGISLHDYRSILKSQEHKCAICGLETLTSGRKLYVDHDHITGKVRGILCNKCNSAIGMYKDSIEIHINAVKYLMKFKEGSTGV